jgi:carbamoyltransferase
MAEASSRSVFLGINLFVDPSVAIVEDGKVLAFSEEERHVRNKHAIGLYPTRALEFCLDRAGVSLDEVRAVGIPWDLPAYTDGAMEAFYRNLRRKKTLDSNTVAWQDRTLRTYHRGPYEELHRREWRRSFGVRRFPELCPIPHHENHALHALMQSPFEEAICLTLDGSGDRDCTVVWRYQKGTIEAVRRFEMPHSLGWFYAAFTEYLGFDAYDGEYKVMGLAAYGRPNRDMADRVSRVLRPAADGVGYELETAYVHDGPHSHSGRYTDHLPELFGRPPRAPTHAIDDWHRDLAYAVQDALEEAVVRVARWAVHTTGIRRLCLSGGVAQNVKLNSRLLRLEEVDDVFAHPLCSDSGAAAGAALVACFRATGKRPERLTTLALGPEQSDAEIEAALRLAHLEYERPEDLCEAVAAELAEGRIVGWFQGRMEAGPRALGQRSILADPRRVESRDRVNAIVKFREDWRPFCPSILAEAQSKYLVATSATPFMIVAVDATPALKTDAPAVVHVDGTVRPQTVEKHVLPRYHRLLEAFGRRTGVPVLLNTSFNVRGEPIVCSITDALRTFWSTGLDVLAAGEFIVRKPRVAAPRSRS